MVRSMYQPLIGLPSLDIALPGGATVRPSQDTGLVYPPPAPPRRRAAPPPARMDVPVVAAAPSAAMAAAPSPPPDPVVVPPPSMPDDFVAALPQFQPTPAAPGVPDYPAAPAAPVLAPVPPVSRPMQANPNEQAFTMPALRGEAAPAAASSDRGSGLGTAAAVGGAALGAGALAALARNATRAATWQPFTPAAAAGAAAGAGAAAAPAAAAPAAGWAAQWGRTLAPVGRAVRAATTPAAVATGLGLMAAPALLDEAIDRGSRTHEAVRPWAEGVRTNFNQGQYLAMLRDAVGGAAVGSATAGVERVLMPLASFLGVDAATRYVNQREQEYQTRRDAASPRPAAAAQTEAGERPPTAPEAPAAPRNLSPLETAMLAAMMGTPAASFERYQTMPRAAPVRIPAMDQIMGREYQDYRARLAAIDQMEGTPAQREAARRAATEAFLPFIRQYDPMPAVQAEWMRQRQQAQ